MELVVRPFQFSDIDDVVFLMGELGYPTSTEIMQRRMQVIESLTDYSTFVADVNGKVVGLIGICRRIMYEVDGVFQIVALVTHSQYRGMGLGKALIQAAEEWAHEAGAARIYLTSGLARQSAHEFYKHLGYEITGHRFVKRFR